jgi:hypothetical protein
MHGSLPADRKTYRPVPDNIACSVIAGVAIAACLYSLAVRFSWAFMVSIVLLAVLLGAQLSRRLVVDDQAVTSRTLLTRRAIPWSAITSFDIYLEPGHPRSPADPPAYSLSIHSADGGPLRIRHTRWSRHYLPRVQAELEAQLRLRRSARA